MNNKTMGKDIANPIQREQFIKDNANGVKVITCSTPTRTAPPTTLGLLSLSLYHVAEKVGYKQAAMLISQRMAMKAYFDMLDIRIDDLKQSNNAPSQTQG